MLHQDQRAVIIHGIGGIGKTGLLTYAINRLRSRFKDVMSFDCRRAALAPETILLELHRCFAKQGMPQLQSLIGQSVPPETLADEIARMLTEWPLLIVFDGFEKQLNEQREIASVDLHVFLTALMQATTKGSRFLFTTRYLFGLNGVRFDNVLELPLGDLSRAEALMLMQKLPNLAQAAYRVKLAVLDKFGGHPKAIVRLNEYCSNQPLYQALQDASSLKSELREYLAIELNYRRLSDQAREQLNNISPFRKPVPLDAVEWMMGENENQDDQISDLIGWGLLMPIQNDGELELLGVHSLVRDFCHDLQEGGAWRNRLIEAAAFYTDLTELTQQDDKTPATVWDEIEAFELLMEAEEFEDAAELLIGAHPLLFRWGFWHYVENLYRRLIDRVKDRTAAVVIHNYGILLHERGEYGQALEKYQQARQILDELGDRVEVAKSLHQIGMIYQDRGEYKEALEKYEQALRIKEELSDSADVALSLAQIGEIHQYQGEYGEALKKYEQALLIHEKLADRSGAAKSLHQIGNLYYLQGEYGEALEKYEQSMLIAEGVSDQAVVAISLHQIGMIHQDRGQHREALEKYERSLRIAEEMGDRAGGAKSLHEIGNLYYLQGEYGEPLEKYEQSLRIAEELGIRAGVADSLHQIGLVYQEKGEYEEALKRYELSLRISEELGDRLDVAKSFLNIGTIHQDRGEYTEALEKYEQSLMMSEELRDRLGVAEVLHNIGTILQHRGEYGKATEKYEQSIAIKEEL